MAFVFFYLTRGYHGKFISIPPRDQGTEHQSLLRRGWWPGRRSGAADQCRWGWNGLEIGGYMGVWGGDIPQFFGDFHWEHSDKPWDLEGTTKISLKSIWLDHAGSSKRWLKGNGFDR